jgi:hypothetical protein
MRETADFDAESRSLVLATQHTGLLGGEGSEEPVDAASGSLQPQASAAGGPSGAAPMSGATALTVPQPTPDSELRLRWALVILHAIGEETAEQLSTSRKGAR